MQPGQPRVVNLDDKSRGDDGRVLLVHGTRNRLEELLGGSIVLVAANQPRCECGHEGFLDGHLRQSGFQVGNVGLKHGLARVRDGSGAHQRQITHDRLGLAAEILAVVLRELLQLRLPDGALRDPDRIHLKSAEAIGDVAVEAGFTLLAV